MSEDIAEIAKRNRDRDLEQAERDHEVTEQNRVIGSPRKGQLPGQNVTPIQGNDMFNSQEIGELIGALLADSIISTYQVTDHLVAQAISSTGNLGVRLQTALNEYRLRHQRETEEENEKKSPVYLLLKKHGEDDLPIDLDVLDPKKHFGILHGLVGYRIGKGLINAAAGHRKHHEHPHHSAKELGKTGELGNDAKRVEQAAKIEKDIVSVKEAATAEARLNKMVGVENVTSKTGEIAKVAEVEKAVKGIESVSKLSKVGRLLKGAGIMTLASEAIAPALIKLAVEASAPKGEAKAVTDDLAFNVTKHLYDDKTKQAFSEGRIGDLAWNRYVADPAAGVWEYGKKWWNDPSKAWNDTVASAEELKKTGEFAYNLMQDPEQLKKLGTDLRAAAAEDLAPAPQATRLDDLVAEAPAPRSSLRTVEAAPSIIPADPAPTAAVPQASMGRSRAPIGGQLALNTAPQPGSSSKVKKDKNLAANSADPAPGIGI